MKRIYLIAGETSGDQLGGWLMEALCKARPDVLFYGIGGSSMQTYGLHSLFPMHELSLMGFAEVVPHLLRIKKRIRETVADIEAKTPDIVLTIDSPGFTFRVVKALRERGVVTPKFIHYVAPTVWAYKPERAKKTSALFDVLLTLLPFEPPYFEREGLTTHFVGHPIAWWWKEKENGFAWRKANGIAADAPLLALFPGSRKGELAVHLPIFSNTVARLKQQYPALETTMLVKPEMKPFLLAHTKHWPCMLHLVTDFTQKKSVFAAATLALAKSGTIGLECTLAGLPSITTYRAHPISAWYIRKKLRTPFVNLANILCREMVIPELIQEACNPKTLSTELSRLLGNQEARETQLRKCSILPAMLGANEATSPSEKAAAIVLGYL